MFKFLAQVQQNLVSYQSHKRVMIAINCVFTVHRCGVAVLVLEDLRFSAQF